MSKSLFLRITKVYKMGKFVVTIVLLSVVIYANSVGGGFVSDDIPGIVKNPQIGKITVAGIRNPVGLSNTIIYKIGGLNPALYHLANIIVHSLNSILVFCFLLIFFGVWPSFWGALLFASHPIHTEAVSWISGKGYLFSTTLILLSFLLYRHATSNANSRESKSLMAANKISVTSRFIGAYLASLSFHIFSFFCGWYAVVYPAMIMLYDFTYNRWRKNWKLWSPYILIALVWVLVRNYAISERVSSVQAEMGAPGMGNPIFNMAFSLFSHAGLLIWPAKLTLYHEPLRISSQLLAVEIISLFLILCLSPLLFKRAKSVFFAIGVFILFLSPTYSPIPISWLVAERYVYLPSVAFCMLAAFFLERYASTGKVKGAAIIFLVILIGAYSVRTIFRNNDWKDRATLWRATVRVSPESPKAHNNMGDIYSIEGDYEKAAREFKIATQLRPDYADAYFNLASTYQKMERQDEAILNYKKAISLKPELEKLMKVER